MKGSRWHGLYQPAETSEIWGASKFRYQKYFWRLFFLGIFLSFCPIASADIEWDRYERLKCLTKEIPGIVRPEPNGEEVQYATTETMLYVPLFSLLKYNESGCIPHLNRSKIESLLENRKTRTILTCLRGGKSIAGLSTCKVPQNKHREMYAKAYKSDGGEFILNDLITEAGRNSRENWQIVLAWDKSKSKVDDFRDSENPTKQMVPSYARSVVGLGKVRILFLRDMEVFRMMEENAERDLGDSECTLSNRKNYETEDALRNFSKTSVLFVSVSFIILMVISLAWLVFYYVQRFRYAHAKDRLARRLFNAAKKALTKIPTRALRQSDRELEMDCPVCIEPYHCSDIIRTLPCKHIFHKTCVDPWLLEHRTCPMCKSDILKAFGYNFGHSDDSVRVGAEDGDRMSAGAASSDGQGSSSGNGSYSGYPYPLGAITDSDIHDPFFPTPSSSPSRVQQVIHPNSAGGFSIIPLTVHSGSVSRPVSSTVIGVSAPSVTGSGSVALGPRSSDSSVESGRDARSDLAEYRLSAEIHHNPVGSSSASDSHGCSASCESSSDDSDSSLSGKPQFGALEPLFRPRPSTAPQKFPAGCDPSSSFHSRSRSAGAATGLAGIAARRKSASVRSGSGGTTHRGPTGKVKRGNSVRHTPVTKNSSSLAENSLHGSKSSSKALSTINSSSSRDPIVPPEPILQDPLDGSPGPAASSRSVKPPTVSSTRKVVPGSNVSTPLDTPTGSFKPSTRTTGGESKRSSTSSTIGSKVAPHKRFEPKRQPRDVNVGIPLPGDGNNSVLGSLESL